MIINDVQFNVSLEDIFAEFKNQLNINGYVYFEKGYRDSGSDIMVQCPYHGNGQERKPSMGIRKSDGICHCFACNETHTLPELISFCFGHDDALGKDGWSWLIKNFATVQVEERKDIELDFGDRWVNIAHEILDYDDNDDNYVTEEELDSYRYYHPYWKKRKITDDDIIELFDLGYDKKTNCITMPVRDINGNCLFVARRSVKTKYFNYPKGVEKPLYGLYELNHCEEFATNHNLPIVWTERKIIICESMIDALTCWQYGKYAVALNGLGTSWQFKQLTALPCRHIILATDNDDAGQKARKRIRDNVKNKIITEYILPENRKDINELSREEFDDLQEVF